MRSPGLPAQWFIALPEFGPQHPEEAQAVLAELRRRNVRSFLLVTSDYHTARARRIFLAADMLWRALPPCAR